MVASEQFPMFRLATLLARQLSSPIATRIKEYAKTHPRFGRSVCMRSGRAAAAAELRFKLWTLQLRPRPGAPPPALSDQYALDAGADLLGEMIIFALGAAIITFEVNRQAMKQEEKVEAERSAWLAVQLQVEELGRELELQQRDLDRLAAALRRLRSQRARPGPAAPPPHSPEPGLESPPPHSPARPEPGLESPPPHSPALTDSDSEAPPPPQAALEEPEASAHPPPDFARSEPEASAHPAPDFARSEPKASAHPAPDFARSEPEAGECAPAPAPRMCLCPEPPA